jgi:hypothetical protein
VPGDEAGSGFVPELAPTPFIVWFFCEVLFVYVRLLIYDSLHVYRAMGKNKSETMEGVGALQGKISW